MHVFFLLILNLFPPRHSLTARMFSLVLRGLPMGLYLSLVSFLFMSFLTGREEGIAPSCIRLSR